MQTPASADRLLHFLFVLMVLGGCAVLALFVADIYGVMNDAVRLLP